MSKEEVDFRSFTWSLMNTVGKYVLFHSDIWPYSPTIVLCKVHIQLDGMTPTQIAESSNKQNQTNKFFLTIASVAGVCP